MKLTVLDLCSGIGGFSYGLERTGYFKTIQFVEIDKFCQKVLKKNFPNIPIHEDINTYKPVNADVVTAGFPCQPFSVAGLRKGINDDRNLWSETFRIITEAKPKWFIGENVEGIINISNGAVLQQIQKDLEKENFQVQCVVIPASGVGAWHQRKRVWIIAYSNNNGHSTQGFSTSNKNKTEFRISGNSQTEKYNVPNSNSRKRNECIHASKVCETKQDRLDSDQERNRNTIRSKVERCSDEQTISNTNSKRLQGHELQSDNLQEKNKTTINSNCSFEGQQTWWEAQSELCGVPNGISYELDKNRANRIKAVGNSICPEVIYEIGKAIKKAEVDIH
jgi:DNA (cytosine-5)-methyltransferase 1